MPPCLAGFELYFENLEAAKRFYRDTLGLELSSEQAGHHARFGTAPFLCLERKGAEHYPSRDKAVVFVEVADLTAMVERLGKLVLQYEQGVGRRPACAVLHDPEGHNVLLIQSSRG
jgi:catechol 2,3-dioxygenase-like lactoylglutathione lyase family enzyme